MKIFIAAFLSSIALTNAKLGGSWRDKKKEQNKPSKTEFDRESFLGNLKPADMGDFHNNAILALGDIYAEEGPANDYALMQDISGVMSSYCPRDDSLCNAFVYKSTLQEFYYANNFGPEIEYSDAFSPEIQQALEITEATIGALDEDNLDEVVNEFDVIIDDIEKMDVANQYEKDLAIASVSVAKGSSMLWHETFTNTESKMHHLVEDKIEHARRRQRKLQDEEEIFVFEVEGIFWDGLFGKGSLVRSIVLSDFKGSVDGSAGIIAEVPERPNYLWPWNWPTLSAYVAAFYAIPASVQIVFGTNSTAVLPNL